MGRGVIDAPLRVVADFIKDIQSSFTYDELVVVSVHCTTCNHIAKKVSSNYV